jgi:hypothetical protein
MLAQQLFCMMGARSFSQCCARWVEVLRLNNAFVDEVSLLEGGVSTKVELLGVPQLRDVLTLRIGTGTWAISFSDRDYIPQNTKKGQGQDGNYRSRPEKV